MQESVFSLKKSERVPRLIEHLYAKMPEVEADRAEIVTEAYRRTENLPITLRRAEAFRAICESVPIAIRPLELVAGSNSLAPRGCQTFPEYSFEWLESELDTAETRSADPFRISEDTKVRLRRVFPYWRGKTSSDLARSLMAPQALAGIDHNLYTPGNYFYNGIGHFSVNYREVLEIGFSGIKEKAARALSALPIHDPGYPQKSAFLKAAIISCDAASLYAKRYAKLAQDMAGKEPDPKRRQELNLIAQSCAWVPENPARSFQEACQSFWFIQSLIQSESSGHSISPGRFDQYMHPWLKKDLEAGSITLEYAQELLDCLWVKFNDLNKIRDKDSAEGFAGYSLFQNLIVGGQTEDGRDATNVLSYMCLEAADHVRLPAPSLSIRVWNGSPKKLLLKAAEVARTGIGLPAFYNDEAIIPSMMSRGLTLAEARDYCIIGCVEPQKAGFTDGWHDAAFFNMCRPLELVFSQGVDAGEQIGAKTVPVEEISSFEELFEAYRIQMEHAASLMVNSINAIDLAHKTKAPLPFQSCMIEDCIEKGLTLQEGGARHNFTGPQGFGIANAADALMAIKKLVFEDSRYTLSDFKEAMQANFGHEDLVGLATAIAGELARQGITPDAEQIRLIGNEIEKAVSGKWAKLLSDIQSVPKYGNDIDEVDSLAREVAYLYTKPLEKHKNPRGGIYQAGLYPVSANVPLGASTGATPDGRLKGAPLADGVGPAQGRDEKGPTAACNSVAKLDHIIASNGTLFNQKFHPTALAGQEGLEKFVALVRGFFDQKGMHAQFNVVDRETLLDAQKNPSAHKNLVVRVAGYSALFISLSKSLQDDIISRTTHGFAS
ncbi:MAG: glycyl radical protein [Clostridiales bacterium]|jgi:formate C-acetyltransferase|nr:glycyl radical protein [Clostridiales bacterium]